MRFKLVRKETARSRAGHLLITLVAMLSVAPGVFATPVYINEHFNGLDVSAESSLVGQQAMAFVENGEAQAIQCTVTFRNGPELPVKRRETIKPGVKKVFEAAMKRTIVKLTIDVECNK
ncbi:hypothetical protein [Alkalimarinus coralli]|uniref:hypothetical protein n=1 Tax=Alkalimarinus coralli TaxID=2935863 RepID=UPI00202B9054|nr:hypothetical protein [Alkalimarinus coralli]